MKVLRMKDIVIDQILNLPVLLDELSVEKEILFDFTNSKIYEPAAMLISGSMIRNFKANFPGIKLRVRGVNDKSYPKTMGYFNYSSPESKIGLNPGEALGSDKYIPIKVIDIEKLKHSYLSNNQNIHLVQMIEIEARKLAKIVSQNATELEELLTFLLKEIIRNTPEHSETSKVWICGQYWSTRKQAEIAVYDEGIGIFKSLQKNKRYNEYITENIDAIKEALKPGVSESFTLSRKKDSNNEYANSGFGLYMTSQLTRSLEGEFILFSGSDYLIAKGDVQRTGTTNLKGTAIGLSIPVNELNDIKKLQSKIASQGEKEAKKIKNNFKKASNASRGMM